MARTRRKVNALQRTPPVSEEKPRRIYRAGGYVRLSVEDSGKPGADTIEAQRELVEGFILSQDDMLFCETYCDNGHTGTDFERPAFLRLMEDIRAGKIDCIVVKDSCVIIGPNQKGSKKLGFSGLVPSFLTEKRTNEKMEIGQAEMHSRFRRREG